MEERFERVVSVMLPSLPAPPPAAPRRRVAFAAPEVISVAGPSALETIVEPIHTSELWAQDEEIRISKLEARLENMNASGLQRRTRRVSQEQYSGHKRTEQHAVEDEPPATIRALAPGGACGSSSSSSAPPTLRGVPTGVPSNLCLMRSSLGGGSAPGALFAGVSPLPSPTFGSGPAAVPAAAQHAPLCLQRATTFSGAGRAPTADGSMGAQGLAAGQAAHPKPSARNPHGLTMSQRVAALQMGFRSQALGQR